jgi:hypothetical protein
MPASHKFPFAPSLSIEGNEQFYVAKLDGFFERIAVQISGFKRLEAVHVRCVKPQIG